MANQANYEKLKKIWYKKLEKSGFRDLESSDGQLRGGSSNWKFNSAWTTAYSQQAKQDYYYLATHFLNTYKFENKLHRAIWEYHVEGIPYRSISQTLRKVGIKKCYQRIGQIISHYKKIMKKENGLK
jgi:hypothetical protein